MLQEEFIYRGVSDNKSLSNPSYAGIFFAADEFDAHNFGDIIHVYDILSSANIYVGSSSYDCCKENNLMNIEDPTILKLTGEPTLTAVNNAFDNNTPGSYMDYNPDLFYAAFQYMARLHLEAKGYDGAHWMSEDDMIYEQYQIWHPEVLKEIQNNSLTEDLLEGSNIDDLKYLQLAKEYIETEGELAAIELRKLVDKAALKKGYNVIAYHGTPYKPFKRFKGNMFFFSNNEEFAYNYAETKSFDNAMDATPKVLKCYLNTSNLFNAFNKEHLMLLKRHLPDEINYGFANHMISKDEYLNLIQGKDTVLPLWTREQLADKKFGDYAGYNRAGYNNDVFVGIDKDDNVVLIHNTYKEMLKLATEEQKQRLLNGKEITIDGYVYGSYILTREEYLEQKAKYEADPKNQIPYWFFEHVHRIFTPFKYPMYSQDFEDCDTWTYFELTTIDVNGKLGSVVDLIRSLGFNGLLTSEDHNITYVMFNARDIKSAALVTYSDGEIVPLSKRFNKRTAHLSESFNPNLILNKAKELLGTTSNIREAGFINIDGSFLKIDDYAHKDIVVAFKDSDIQYSEDAYLDLVDDSVEQYILLGNIRIEKEFNGLQLGPIEPTEAQYDSIRDYIDFILDTERQWPLYIEYYRALHQPAECVKFDIDTIWNADTVINSIRDYYKNL